MNTTENSNKSKDEQANDKRQGWNAGEISEQASQEDENNVQRQIKRGDESEGNPNERDHAGNINSNETPQGREEAKNDTEGKANNNG